MQAAPHRGKDCLHEKDSASPCRCKNNKPRYRVVEIEDEDTVETAADEDVLAVSQKLLKRNAAIYEELAK